VLFEDIPQRLVLNFASGTKGGKPISLALLIPSSFDSQVLIDHLKTLRTASPLPDYLLSGSLYYHLNDPDASLTLLCYVSLNPTTSSKASHQPAYPPSTDLPLLPNLSLLALTTSEILFLRQTWSKWTHVPSPSVIEEALLLTPATPDDDANTSSHRTALKSLLSVH
jgi:hypothetical protein